MVHIKSSVSFLPLAACTFSVVCGSQISEDLNLYIQKFAIPEHSRQNIQFMSRNTESFNYKNLIHVSYRCDILPIFRIGNSKFQGISINIDYPNAYIYRSIHIYVLHTLLGLLQVFLVYILRMVLMHCFYLAVLINEFKKKKRKKQ